MRSPPTSRWCASWRRRARRATRRSRSPPRPRRSSRRRGHRLGVPAIALEPLAKHWYRETAVTRLLAPLAFLFGAAAGARRALYRAGVLPVATLHVPVIVVGNLNLGGSGKTPLVLWIEGYLRSKGWRPGVVSRGHGGRNAAQGAGPVEVTAASDPAIVGDEPVLLARRAGCPVWVGADRAAACRALLAQHPGCDVLVLDDGLQHYALARDLEIAVVDARGVGNGRLFPAGPLREPASRLRSVDAVVANGPTAPDLKAGYAMRVEGGEFVNLATGAKASTPEALGSRRVHAIAGIGDPSRFFAHLEALGLEVVPHAFPDHHPYVAADFAFGDRLPVVMTEKDAVKCVAFAAPHFWMLPVRAELDPAFGPMLEEKLRAKLQGKRRGPEAA